MTKRNEIQTSIVYIQDDLSPQHKAALSVLSYIGGSLSLIGCTAAIVMFRMFKYNSNVLKVNLSFFSSCEVLLAKTFS